MKINKLKWIPVLMLAHWFSIIWIYKDWCSRNWIGTLSPYHYSFVNTIQKLIYTYPLAIVSVIIINFYLLPKLKEEKRK